MTKPIDVLSQEDVQIIRECLSAAEKEGFFPEWEFETLFGISRSKVSAVLAKWPDVDVYDPDVSAAIVGALNHLLGYPHAQDDLWNKYISVGPDGVRSTLDHLLALGV